MFKLNFYFVLYLSASTPIKFIYQLNYTMSPTDKEIKILALKNILRQRKGYDSEIEEREDQLKESEMHQNEENYDAQLHESMKKIHDEVITLRNLCNVKVREIAADLRESSGEETNESIELLLQEAARYYQDIS